MTNPSATSTTRSRPATVKAYASLRFMGDRLDPDRVTAVLRVTPTLAYRKGEIWKRSPRHEYRGRTGLWLLSTRHELESLELLKHLRRLLDVLFPEGGPEQIGPVRALMHDDELEADVTCFWYGEHGATPPAIPADIRAAFAQIGATIETDFQSD